MEAEVYLLEGGLRIQSGVGQNSVISNWRIKDIIPDRDAGDGRLILQYKANRVVEYIESEDAAFLDALRRSYPDHIFVRQPPISSKRVLAFLLAAASLFIVGLVLAYSLLLPRLSAMLASRIPVEWEAKLGEQLFEQTSAELKIDTARSALLDSFFKEMRVPTHYTIKLHYAYDDQINAFAMPGGNIVVYNGLVSNMTHYAQLAALIGHELAHVHMKHSLQSAFRSLSLYVLFSIFFGDLTGIAAVLTENASFFIHLSFSREFEQEADEYAFNILKERRIDAGGLTSLFEVLKNSHAGVGDIPKFLSTHPLPKDRIVFAQRLIEKNPYSPKEQERLNYLFGQIKK